MMQVTCRHTIKWRRQRLQRISLMLYVVSLRGWPDKMLCRTGIDLEIHGLNSDVLYVHKYVGVKSRMSTAHQPRAD